MLVWASRSAARARAARQSACRRTDARRPRNLSRSAAADQEYRAVASEAEEVQKHQAEKSRVEQEQRRVMEA